MSFEWVAGACVVGAASFVMGLAGFGIGLVALAFLPFLMAPATAVVLMTVYAFLFAVVLFVPLRRHLVPGAVADLLIGTVLAMPAGVWALATLPAPLLNRSIGGMLVAVVLLEWSGQRPTRLHGRGWSLGAGALSGLLGGAVGTPGPPVVLYATAQGWSPRAIKANLQAFFIVNEAVILAGYWWAGLVTRDVVSFAAAFALPALLGAGLGASLFDRVDPDRFRKLVFAILFLSGAALLVRG